MKKSFSIRIFIIIGFIFCCSTNPEDNHENRYVWNISKPETQQMNSQILDSVFVQAGLTGYIDCLLVIRNGLIIGEQYYNGYDASQPHNIMSVSKSFLSAIIGLALNQGDIDSLDEKIMNYFLEYVYPGIDPRKYDITVRHLLMMRMGIRDEAEDNYYVYWELYNSDNWIKTTLESPLVNNPGEKMNYNTFQTHLLSGIITKATQKSTLDFANEFLFRQMQIDVDSWEKDPQGYYFGGNSMFFTPREMAVLGFLYLNEGNLNGIQIVPKEWIEFTLLPSTNLNHPNEWGEFKNYDYAYLWWLGQIQGENMFMAYGYGGQFVIVFPDLNLIVVSTAKNQVDPDISTAQEWAIFELVSKYVLPAIENG